MSVSILRETSLLGQESEEKLFSLYYKSSNKELGKRQSQELRLFLKNMASCAYKDKKSGLPGEVLPLTAAVKCFNRSSIFLPFNCGAM